MMRLAAAAVIFLCSIAAVSAQEPTGIPSDQPEQKTCVFAGENYSEGAEFVSQAMLASNVKAASGHATLS